MQIKFYCKTILYIEETRQNYQVDRCKKGRNAGEIGIRKEIEVNTGRKLEEILDKY